ncbi:ABC transporter permease [Ruminococcus gauvreauii]|uniref:ABC transporter permease n=1 Tax=Ruminococcus gauvreauii TaxID=438033 RepID=A0ABY5VI79_9FIRM|nr:ABC transporter permease [Ruminococcus gauvreauii]UWP60107.1 ABC transporter permease [Ruminococcus gauvreauii]
MTNTKTNKKWSVAEIYSRFGIFIILVIAVIVASFLSDAFFTTRNLSNIIRQNAVIMIIAFGSQMVLITGGCDLSPGSVCALSGVISTMVMVSTGNPVISLVVGILIGAFCGFINGLVITSCGIPDFIMTLASQFICRGAVLAITQAQPISGFDESYTVFGQGYVGPIPVPTIILILVLIFYWVLMNRRRFGRYVYAVGGNTDAARASGINTKKVKTQAYLFAGAAAGLAGVILMSRMNSGQPNGGEQYEFDAITAAIIGGTSMNGGTGKVYGVVVGALFVGVLLNIMTQMDVSAYWQKIVKGLIIALAVIIDVQVRKTRKA